MIYLLSPIANEETVSLPMISFSSIEAQLEVKKYDLLMFTSKQAVVEAEVLNPLWKNVPCLAIGKATAKQIKSLGGEVVYHPDNFYGVSLGKDIIEKFNDKKILYIRPKAVSFDSKTFLANAGIQLDEKILYETKCRRYELRDKPVAGAIIIFTSPSTIKCFLENFDWEESYIAVVIGEATKKHLPANIKVFVAHQPLISACILKAKELLISNQI